MSSIQAVLFKKPFTTKKARAFLKKNGFKPIKRVDKTKNFLRYRIRDPKQFKRFRTISFTKNIKAVVGFV